MRHCLHSRANHCAEVLVRVAFWWREHVHVTTPSYL